MSKKVYLASGGEYSDYRVYAVFATREAAEAFIAHKDSYASEIEERTLYEDMPPQETWFVIERVRPRNELVRRTQLWWEFDGPPYVGYRRKAANYSKWEYGERAFGMDEAAVEKVWREAHAVEEAEKAGLL